MNIIKLKRNKLVDSVRLGFDRLSIRLRGSCPIVVHAMPKTGGTTVHHSVQACTKQRVFHTHSLDGESLDEKEEQFRRARGGAPYHIGQGRMLGSYIAEERGNGIKVISLVRDPVSRLISLFFQTGKAFHSQWLDSAGKYDVGAVSDHLCMQIRNMPAREESREMEWFRREFSGVLGIDVFSASFGDDGFVNMKSGKIDVLVMRLEDLDRCAELALRPFIDTQNDFSLLVKNKGNAKDYADDYDEVRAAIRIPRDILRDIYEDCFMKHFYTEEMIETFVEKWSSD